MGGPGSGRHRVIHNRRGLVEDAYILDASELIRAGILKPGQKLTTVWEPQTKTRARTGFRINVEVDCNGCNRWDSHPSVVLRYLSPTGGKPITTRILLTTTVPFGGGVRWWFRC